MLLRPLNFILIYIVQSIHFLAIIIPFSIIFFVFIKYISGATNSATLSYIMQLWWILLFIVLLFISTYVVLDMILGFTAKKYLKKSKNINVLKEYVKISDAFEVLKLKFNKKNVELRILHDEDINAYALGGFKKSYIFLTTGILSHMSEKAGDYDEFIQCICGILGHEMSHIINSDFIIGLFVNASEIAINIVTRVLYYFLIIIGFTFSLIPIIGRFSFIFLLSHKFVMFFTEKILYEKIIVPIDFILKMALSRRVEYRSDRDAAIAFGNTSISTALSKLGSNYGMWRTIFSSHPPSKQRIKKLGNVKKGDNIISPDITTEFMNIWCILMLFFFTACVGFSARIDKAPYYAIKTYNLTHAKYLSIEAYILDKIRLGQKVYEIYKKVEKLIS